MNNTWKIRLDKIAYGLFYPAFFGNMIYDLINIFLGKIKLSFGIFDIFSHFAICSLVIIFVVIDFIHLQADMNETYKKPSQKSPAYLLCDIITPSLLFLAFVFFKNQLYAFGIIAFGLVPCVLFFYKRENLKSKKYFKSYSIFSFVTFVVLALSTLTKLDMIYIRAFIELFLIICLCIYWRYIFFIYPYQPKIEDENIAKGID
jgi:hypothetical protein